jgi:tetratricopeptide (TPR) repeat protein
METGFPPIEPGSLDRAGVSYRRAATSGVPETHAAARAALARGEYSTAIDEYHKVLESNPDDALAYSEISRTICDHLGDATAAASTLEEALDREWPQDEAALLCMRLVDVYWNFQRDAQTARALLVQIKETMPGTQHAMSAQKRLHEINEQAALQHRQ